MRIGEQLRFDFEHYQLPMDKAPEADFKAFNFNAATPAYHRAELFIDGEAADTFLRIPGTHGCIFVNGFNLGRYWNIGPQQTLYLPGCLLKQGKNELIIFETDKLETPYIESVDSHKFSKVIKFADMVHLI